MALPAEELAEAIVPLLVQGKLFLQEDGARYRGKMAAGSMKPEDWLLAIEKAMDKEVNNGGTSADQPAD